MELFDLSKHKTSRFLVGVYRSDKNQQQWIGSTRLYNVRIKYDLFNTRFGEMQITEKPQFVLIFDYKNWDNFIYLYQCIGASYKTEEEMISLNYPKPHGTYYVYELGVEYQLISMDMEGFVSAFKKGKGTGESFMPSIFTGEQLWPYTRENELNGTISLQEKPIQLGTLFSGIGAIEQAFEKMNLDHEIVFACDNGERELKESKEEIEELFMRKTDIDKEKILSDLYYKEGGENMMERSYKANYTIKGNRFFQDIRFLDGMSFRNNVDIIVGGSPCQAFSSNGKRGGFEDTRGTLFYEYARIINEAQPKCFIFENVRGMVSHDKGRTWQIIKQTFKELKYRIYIHHNERGQEDPILDAVDYGIPQLRRRLFVVGIRNDINLQQDFRFPEKVKLGNMTVNDYLDADVDAKYYMGRKGFEFVTTHPSRAQVGVPVMTCQKANQQFNWNGTFIFEPLSAKHNEEILKRAFVGEWKGQRGVIRMFTPRECLRLMGFSDKFKIRVSDTMMWRQCGNSIAVNVLEKLMRQLIITGVFNTK